MRIVCDRCDKIMDSPKSRLLTTPKGDAWYLCDACFDSFLEFLDELRYPPAGEFADKDTAQYADNPAT